MTHHTASAHPQYLLAGMRGLKPASRPVSPHRADLRSRRPIGAPNVYPDAYPGFLAQRRLAAFAPLVP